MSLTAPDAAAGKRAKCPNCGHVTLVPQPPQQADEFAEPPAASGAPTAHAESYDLFNIVSELQPPSQTGGAGAARRPCPECGEMIAASARKCRFCDAIFDYRLRAAIGNRLCAKSYNGMAVTSLVLGIVTYPGMCMYVLPGVIFALKAIIFGSIALSGMKKSGNTEGKGMAITGIVLGTVPLALGALALLSFLMLAASVRNH